MITTTVSYLRRHALAATAFVCSILALAGSSYAAFTISGSQIRNHTINPVKLNPKFINGNVRAWAIVAPNGRVIAGAGGPKVSLVTSEPGGYTVRWHVRVGRCVTDATIDSESSPPTEHVPIPGDPAAAFSAGYAVGATSGLHNETAIQTFDQRGQPMPLAFDVAVIC